MATQRLIIVKLMGQAADVTCARFHKWRLDRLIELDDEWGPDQWPAETRTACDQWMEQVRANAMLPPVTYYSEHIDMWSFSPKSEFLETAESIDVYSDQWELHLLRLPLSSGVVGDLQLAADGRRTQEAKWFSSRLLQACEAWGAFDAPSAVLVARYVYAGSQTDEEIQESFQATPPWLPDG